MAFSFRQAPTPVTGASVTSVSATLTSTPNQGNLIIVAVVSANSVATPPTVTVKDANNNVYAATPNSPSLGNSEAITAGAPWLFSLVAPSNASKTITATYASTVGFGYILPVEFTVANGFAVFDVDAAGNGASGTAINTPTITPATAAELLFFLATPAHTITSVNSPWTQASTTASGIACGYVLSGSSGGTAVNCTTNSSGAWEAMAAAFSLVPTGWNNQQFEPTERLEIVGY